jgi:hypothetical protein
MGTNTIDPGAIDGAEKLLCGARISASSIAGIMSRTGPLNTDAAGILSDHGDPAG